MSFTEPRLGIFLPLVLVAVLLLTACKSVDDRPAAPTSLPTSPQLRSGEQPLRELTESFTVFELETEPKTRTVFEKLLSRIPSNELTRQHTQLTDFGGAVDALGLDRIEPGASLEEQNEYFEYIVSFSSAFNLWTAIHPWPVGQRDYRRIIDTFPDVAFDWISVDASASSSQSHFGRSSRNISGVPISYDVAFGRFNLEETKAALDGCECDQPELGVHDGVEYFRWGDGDGIAPIKDRHKRPLYDHIGSKPHLLVRDGEAYYTINDGVIAEHIEVIQGNKESLADSANYVEAARWMASLGIISEMTFRGEGFSVEEVANIRQGVSNAVTLDINAFPLLQPFEFAAIGLGYDGEREFTGLVIPHDDSEAAKLNVDLALTRLYEGVAIREAPGRFTPWTDLIDRVDIEANGNFLIARIYFTRPNGVGSLLIPNTLLVHQ